MNILEQLKLLQIRGKLKWDQICNKKCLPSDKNETWGSVEDIIKHLSANSISLQLSEQDQERKDYIFKLIQILGKYGKKVTLMEMDPIFDSNDIKTILEKNPNVEYNIKYLANSYYNISNVITEYSITDYVEITDKVEYLTQVTKANFKNKDEQAIFVMTQLADYISFDMEYEQKSKEEIKQESTLKAALLERKTVCIGHAMACQRCLAALGIECNVMMGYAGNQKIEKSDYKLSNHAWNQVKLKDEWYNADISVVSKQKNNEEIAERYLLGSDEEFSEYFDTKACEEKHKCSNTYNRKKELYHKMKNIKNVLEAYDLGSRSTMLQYNVQNSTISTMEKEQQKEQKIDREIE